MSFVKQRRKFWRVTSLTRKALQFKIQKPIRKLWNHKTGQSRAFRENISLWEIMSLIACNDHGIKRVYEGVLLS